MSNFNLSVAVSEMRSLALDALPRMYHPDSSLFAFRLRRSGGADVLEGISHRYTAIVLLALAGESADVQRAALPQAKVDDLCDRLLDAVSQTSDAGEAALTLWAARVLGHARAGSALGHLKSMRPCETAIPTVELAWVLSALCAPSPASGSVGVNGGAARGSDEALARRIADRLMASFCEETGLFTHHAEGSSTSRLRSHVCCFADLVYPIQALSFYHKATGDERALAIATQCAGTMCRLQGPAGQWWWHYDIRTARVVEGFPVYAVHQDAMGPMALAALRQAGGDEFPQAIEKSVRWLYEPPELDESLIDRQARVIWRKLARREPRKFARRLQAAFSSAHPILRAPGVDVLFPPRSVDYESRPYHMAWILYAWPGDQT